ncbi:hypothetical protein GVN21_10855 [Caulobacter sp. SLTY]|uniref:hypothetical protein n=1 Tax=Caulobacter sp. SLTY TaxID=2683262 RepID=UPI0014133286|nr:hypothetical protein [Caulobacter sp. SLTY]NBB15854.1 hypothetical protein [Caulobacter sp. SLTY]
MSKHALALLALFALPLAACEKSPEAPWDKGVCWHAVTKDGGKTFRFNKIKSNVPQIENCAAELEGMRQRFLALGGGNRELIGAYQGSYLIANPRGIFRREKWNGGQYLMLERTGDGRLAQPGAMPIN